MQRKQTVESDFRSEDFLDAKLWRDGGIVHIDVSDLPAPDPFVAIMRLIAHPAVGDTVVFHNDQEPVHLFPELLDIGWTYRIEVNRPGSFRMSLFRDTGA